MRDFDFKNAGFRALAILFALGVFRIISEYGSYIYAISEGIRLPSEGVSFISQLSVFIYFSSTITLFSTSYYIKWQFRKINKNRKTHGKLQIFFAYKIYRLIRYMLFSYKQIAKLRMNKKLFNADSIFLVMSVVIFFIFMFNIILSYLDLNPYTKLIIIIVAYFTFLMRCSVFIGFYLLFLTPRLAHFYLGGVVIFFTIAVWICSPTNYKKLLKISNFGGNVFVSIANKKDLECVVFSEGYLVLRTNDVLMIRKDVKIADF